MSFTGTPLGQGRRLDHQTFMNGAKRNTNSQNQEEDISSAPDSPRRSIKQTIPLSYAYGAPTLSNRSPQKPTSSRHRNPSPTRSTKSSTRRDEDYEEESNDSFSSAHAKEPGVVRYARLKQRNLALGPGTILSPPKPNGASLKDTSVNIASAFNQAAAASIMPSAVNYNSHASGSRNGGPSKETYNPNHTTTTAGKDGLPGPPRRAGSKPLSKGHHEIADSEEDIDADTGLSVARGARAKSPLETVHETVQNVVRAFSPAARYFVRQKPGDTEEEQTQYQSMIIPNTSQSRSGTQLAVHPSHGNLSNESSDYNYSREEQLVTNMENMDAASKRAAAKKRGRISMDNKAYKPNTSDAEYSSEEDEDELGTRRKKKKKDVKGLNLPVIGGYSNKRKPTKRKSTKGSRTNAKDDDASGAEAASQPSIRGGSVIRSIRGSIPPSALPNDPNQSDSVVEDDSFAIDDTLNDFHEEPPAPPVLSDQEMFNEHSELAPQSRGLTFGAALGKVVHFSSRAVYSLLYVLFRLLATIMLLVGHIGRAIYDMLFARPASWVMKVQETLQWSLIGKSIVVLFLLWIAVFVLRAIPSGGWLSDYPWNVLKDYQAPDTLPSSFEEVIRRLTQVENTLSDVTVNIKTRSDADLRASGQSITRLAALELRIESEIRRAIEAEEKYRLVAMQGISSLRDEWHALVAHSVDKDLLSHLTEEINAIEDRLGLVETGVKQAIQPVKPSSNPTPGWLGKWMPNSDGRSTLVINGQDVTPLIATLVDSAVSRISKDYIAKADYALSSGGGQIIPSLTSKVYEIKPSSWGRYLVGSFTGTGFAHGNSPVHAIHPDLNVGNCWPFHGSTGQIGIKLSRSVLITEFTIDHVAKEVAQDLRAAPRLIEVWGFVDGRDNARKVSEYHNRRKSAARNAGIPPPADEDPYPTSLPRSPHYLRLATFAYDIHASSHVQTFQVPSEIQELGIDFGIVVARILSNWGDPDFTCLYRIRVHGTDKDHRPLPSPDIDS